MRTQERILSKVYYNHRHRIIVWTIEAELLSGLQKRWNKMSFIVIRECEIFLYQLGLYEYGEVQKSLGKSQYFVFRGNLKNFFKLMHILSEGDLNYLIPRSIKVLVYYFHMAERLYTCVCMSVNM